MTATARCTRLRRWSAVSTSSRPFCSYAIRCVTPHSSRSRAEAPPLVPRRRARAAGATHASPARWLCRPSLVMHAPRRRRSAPATRIVGIDTMSRER
eukprot:6196598-Pleurochrysis_carterae.AAC.1